jgi:hypothetical protein
MASPRLWLPVTVTSPEAASQAVEACCRRMQRFLPPKTSAYLDVARVDSLRPAFAGKGHG